MTSLSPSLRDRVEAQRFLRMMPTQQIVDLLICFSERHQIPPHVITRTVDPLLAELRRREALGFDDPFESPYPEITW
jgi:hypothetical protein